MSTASSPSRFRLQFSLRALLLLTLLVGVGLTVYRWPWKVEKVNALGLTTTTTYHRGWNGKSLRHGLEVENKPIYAWHRWYFEDELQRERIMLGNTVIAETTSVGRKPPK